MFISFIDAMILLVKQVLIRLIGADETIYSNYADTLQWLENTDVLEMIVDKFSSSVSFKA
jgi:serine/threonine-protein phosphatase 6 regulatory subunit 3